MHCAVAQGFNYRHFESIDFALLTIDEALGEQLAGMHVNSVGKVCGNVARNGVLHQTILADVLVASSQNAQFNLIVSVIALHHCKTIVDTVESWLVIVDL